MRRRSPSRLRYGSRAARLAISLGSLLLSSVASAQLGGGGGGMRPMGPGGGAPPGGDQKEEEQAAEAAPEQPGQEPALQPLPAWPGQREKTTQFFQLNGYLRGRTYLFHNFNLGINEGAAGGPKPPFYVPYSEAPNGNALATCAAREKQSCRTDNLTSADMRFRLEPTINISDQVRVKAQIDIFDNMVLGSTPEGYYINGQSTSQDVPLHAFTRSQQPPESGSNSLESSIRVKRAWAEVRTPIGELRFGRMPSHWGTGMFVNSGDCLDCDYGSNVDRVMFATKLFNHFIALIWDWVATGPTTKLYNPNQAGGPSYNADTLDDVSQWALAIGRQDKPEELRERVERGELVLNYGGYFVYRRQDWDETSNPGQNNAGGIFPGGTTATKISQTLAPRHAWAFIPDLWFRLNWRKLHIELEGTMILGAIDDLTDYQKAFTKARILEFGGVGRIDYKLLHDALHLGFEVGYASGDSGEDQSNTLNYRQAQIVRKLCSTPGCSTTLSNFQFDPDYHVDLILFRRILGTVTNATYFKPSAAYDLLDNLSARVDVIYSIANVPVGYPGNGTNLGLELDGAIMYHNDEEGFYAGIAYGVLFPFQALNHSVSGTNNLPGFSPAPANIYGTAAKEAEAAQTVQARVVVKF